MLLAAGGACAAGGRELQAIPSLTSHELSRMGPVTLSAVGTEARILTIHAPVSTKYTVARELFPSLYASLAACSGGRFEISTDTGVPLMLAGVVSGAAESGG